MKRLLDLWESKLKDTFAIFGFAFFWVVLFSIILSYVPMYVRGFFTEVEIYNPFKIPRNQIYNFVYGCILAPFGEELIFRVAPVMILARLKLIKKVGLEVMFAISLIFGFMHGGNWNIFVQGVVGMGLSYLYLKHRSYLMIVFVHFLWNFIWMFAIQFLAK